VQIKPRVPSLDDPDESAEFPKQPARANTPRPNTRDEAAAMDALADLDGPVKRVESAAAQAAAAASKLEEVAQRVESAAARVETSDEVRQSAPRRAVQPIIEPPIHFDLPPPKLKSRMFGVVMTLLVIGGGVGFYMIYKNQQDAKAAATADKEKKQKEADAQTKKLTDELPDPGAIRVRSNPSQAGVWLKIGRTPVDSLPLSSAMMHEIRVEGVDGYQPVDTQVIASHWSGEKAERKAKIVVTLKPNEKDAKGKTTVVKLPAMPAKPPEATGFTPGRGPIRVESSPSSAEVWMYVGMTDSVELTGIQAGMPYELRVLKDGHRPAYISITPDEWRAGGDPNIPINAAKKKEFLEKSVDLEPEKADGEKEEKKAKVEKKKEKKGT
jgi:hypothetical protein